VPLAVFAAEFSFAENLLKKFQPAIFAAEFSSAETPPSCLRIKSAEKYVILLLTYVLNSICYIGSDCCKEQEQEV